jgi:hypothetical protein
MVREPHDEMRSRDGRRCRRVPCDSRDLLRLHVLQQLNLLAPATPTLLASFSASSPRQTRSVLPGAAWGERTHEHEHSRAKQA